MSTSSDVERHITRPYDSEMSDREFNALVGALARAIFYSEDMTYPVRQRMQKGLAQGDKADLLRNALALASQFGMDPRKSDPNYPLD